MRGYPLFNFPAFHEAAKSLRAEGWEVWSPAERDMSEDGFDPATSTAKTLREYMVHDLPAVLASDAVIVLPGWEQSRGASLEVYVARETGIPVWPIAEAWRAREGEK